MTELSTDANGRNATQIPLDDRHRALADERRRVLLAVLGELTAPVEVDKLAAEVAAVEDGDAPERVALSLHHAHLPLLADLGVIDYDRERNRVTTCRYSLTDLRP